MTKSERSETRKKLKNGIFIALLVSAVSLLFSVLAIAKVPDKEYYSKITGYPPLKEGDHEYNSVQYVEDKRNIKVDYKKDETPLFKGSNGELPLLVVSKSDTIGNINFVIRDTANFTTDDDQTRITVHNTGLYLIGYNINWNELDNDNGTSRETLIQSSNHKMFLYSRGFTHKPEPIQQHMTHIEDLSSGEWLRLLFRQNSNKNITISSFSFWLKMLSD